MWDIFGARSGACAPVSLCVCLRVIGKLWYAHGDEADLPFGCDCNNPAIFFDMVQHGDGDS